MAAESTNTVKVSGPIVELESREGQTRKGSQYLAGKMKVKAGEDNIIPISFFTTKTKNDGTPNGLYNSIQSVVQDYKTIAEHGPDAADSVEITSGSLKENTFFSNSGNFIRGFQIDSVFYNRKANATPGSEFIVSGEVMKVEPELKDDVPTGAVLLTLLVVGYGNRANLIDFYVPAGKKAEYVQSVYQPGMEVKIDGEIQVIETVEETKEEMAFGDPITNTKRKTDYKLVVNGGTAPIDSTIPEAEKTEMLSVRENYIAEQKEAQNKPKKAKSASKEFTL